MRACCSRPHTELVATDSIPPSVRRTLLLDTDTVFAQAPEKLWRRFRRFRSEQVLAAAPLLEEGLGCVRSISARQRQRTMKDWQFNQVRVRT